MAQKDLIPMNKRTKEEQKRIATMGGKASGEIRRKQKSFREMVQQIAAMGAPAKVIRKLKRQGISEEDATYQAAIVLQMFAEAIEGNVAAFNAIINASGEIINKHELSGKDGRPLQVSQQLSMAEVRARLKELDEE